jgi:hypothetical protein
MNKTYQVRAKVDQIVTKEIHLDVLAGSEEEAEDKARAALGEYPEAVTSPNIKRMVTVKQHYWIPKSIEFGSTKEENKDA